ncbi:MAG: phospholipase A [Burkholderiaceae bacterium]|nr:phospholipase A [Burkholderiaceae bacterium]
MLGGLALAAVVQAQPLDLERCARLEDPLQRLACFDRQVPPPAGAPASALAPLPAAEPSLLGERWSIGVAGRDSRFDLRAHKPSYLLPARYSDAPNRLPASPTKPPLAKPLDLQASEAKFQLSFKVKLADFGRIAGRLPPAALWIGYTQQSQWQVYNAGTSRPFRETNYEPEAILAFHPDRTVLGWRWRLAAVGFNHQSNGRAEPLSRSWNRVYLLAGVERGDFGLLARAWMRIREDYAKDDNPDITRYLGYGDLVAVYRQADHTLSLLARYNPASGKGAAQLAWNFPLQRRVRGYLQLFSGYGESLIDYNVRQNTIGLGVSLADFL